MAAPVYDDEDTRQGLTDPLEDMYNAPAISDEERAYNQPAISDDERNAGGSQRARSLLGREREAATGRAGARQQMGKAPSNPNIQRGGLGAKRDASTESNVVRGGLGGTGLRKREEAANNDHLFNENDSGGGGFKNWSRRKRLMIAGTATGVISGGGFLGLLGIISGPAQIVQIGQLMQMLHLDEKNSQSDSRFLKQARNFKYIVTGQIERTRLGLVGNAIADKIDTRMRSAGIEPRIENGKFLGYTIDPTKLRGDDFSDMTDRSANGAKQFIQEKLGVPTEVTGDGKLVYDAGGRARDYFSDRRMLRSTLKLAGFNSVTGAISSNLMRQRFNITFHPLKKLAEKGDKKFKAWVDKFKSYVRNGSKPVAPTIDREKSTNKEGASTAEEVVEEGKAVGDDEGKLAKFRESVGGKFAAKGIGLIGVVCLLKFVSDTWDDIMKANILIPMARIGMDAVSLAAQLVSGVDVDEQQLGYYSNLLYDSKAKTSWSDARSVNAQTSAAASGPDIPQEAKINPEGNPVTRFISSVPGVDFACSSIGGVILIGVAAVLLAGGGWIAAGVAFAVGVGAQIGISYFTDMVANLLSANVVPALAAGAMRGSFIDYGVLLGANDTAAAKGSLPLPTGESKKLSDASQEYQQEEFEKQDLATRLLDPNDSRSLFGKVLQNQAPNPTDNISKFASGFLDIGKRFGTVLLSPFNSVLHAAPIANYDYGFPDVAFSKAEMNNVNFENPFENADRVAEILDANAAVPPKTNSGLVNYDNYIERAKACFGATISSVQATSEDGAETATQYKVNPPTANMFPTYKNMLVSDTAGTPTHCMDGQLLGDDTEQPVSDWLRIRMWLMDSETANAAACYINEDTDAIGKQACIDIGFSGSPSAGGTRDDPICGGTYTGAVGGSTQSAPAGGATIKVAVGGDVGAAVESANPGDIVAVAPGNYGQLSVSKSGAPQKCITIMGDGGMAIFDGGITMGGVQWVRLLNLTSTGSGSYGIEANGAKNIVMSNVEVNGSADGGIQIAGSALEGGDATKPHIIIDGCNVHGTNGGQDSSGEGEAISIADGTTNAEVRFCKVHENGEEGIDVKYSNDKLTNSSVHDNEVWSNGGPNVYIDGVNGVKVFNNKIYDVYKKGQGKSGIMLGCESEWAPSSPSQNIEIYNNETHDNDGRGIVAWDGGCGITNVNVHDNKLSGGDVIDLGAATNVTEANNTTQ